MSFRVDISIDGKGNEEWKRNETGGTNHMYFFLISYPILGAGLKYIDEAFDEQLFSKKSAYLLAPLLGILWAYAMIINPISATILLAIILGVLLKGKIDNKAHLIGLLSIFGIVLVSGVQLLVLPLIVLTVSALLDEVGNDFIDKKGFLENGRGWQRFVGYFFDQRWLTKIAILGLVIVSVFPWYFFVSMFLFDGAYLGVRSYSQWRLRMKGVSRDSETVKAKIVVSE
ncbi:MAG: hypothetical protein V1726_03610 [Methanobacteriota archaeon]